MENKKQKQKNKVMQLGTGGVYLKYRMQADNRLILLHR
jgi:hypothetical protein